MASPDLMPCHLISFGLLSTTAFFQINL